MTPTMTPLLWSRFLSSWIAIVTLFVLTINQTTDDGFYRWGPHADLVLFGVVVDTWTKYSCVILYSVVNVSLRNVEQNILRPYLLLHVQDETSEEAMVRKQTLNHAHIYEITVLVTLYTWFDWFMYMQMLLTQVDMVFIEAAADMVVSLVVTRWYLRGSGADAMKPMTYASI